MMPMSSASVDFAGDTSWTYSPTRLLVNALVNALVARLTDFISEDITTLLNAEFLVNLTKFLAPDESYLRLRTLQPLLKWMAEAADESDVVIFGHQLMAEGLLSWEENVMVHEEEQVHFDLEDDPAPIQQPQEHENHVEQGEVPYVADDVISSIQANWTRGQTRIVQIVGFDPQVDDRMEVIYVAISPVSLWRKISKMPKPHGPLDSGNCTCGTQMRPYLWMRSRPWLWQRRRSRRPDFMWTNRTKTKNREKNCSNPLKGSPDK
jgi:hypothetical protein